MIPMIRSLQVFGVVPVAQSLVFFVVFCVLLFVGMSFLVMVLTVYFRYISYNTPLVSFAPMSYLKKK